MKRIFMILLLFYDQGTIAQKLVINPFVRLPQVTNCNFTNSEILRTPVISTGLTIFRRNAFLDCDTYGH